MKSGRPRRASPIFDRMNPQFLGWGMGSRYRGAPPRRSSLARSGRQRGHADPRLPERAARTRTTSSYDVVSAAYPIASPARACIIGGGGGRDILKALQGGATDVEVVELNPYTVDAVSRVFSAHSGDPVPPAGRAVVRRRGAQSLQPLADPCDVIEISQIDTFAASAAGAYALTENSLYTVEAIRMFWSHLSDARRAVRLTLGRRDRRGRSRCAWSCSRSKRSARKASRSRAITWWCSPPARRRTCCSSGKPVTRGSSSRSPKESPPSGDSPSCGRSRPARADVSELTRALAHGPHDMTRRGYDVSPPTDDRPFFFQTLNILSGTSRAAEVGTEREQSVTLLRRLVGILGGLVVVLVLLPVAARGTLPRGPHFARSTLFFACLGFGFMFVEIPLLQRLAVYLGHPSYSTTVVLGSLLVGAGSRGVARRAHPGIPAAARRRSSCRSWSARSCSLLMWLADTDHRPVVRRARRDFGRGADARGRDDGNAVSARHGELRRSRSQLVLGDQRRHQRARQRARAGHRAHLRASPPCWGARSRPIWSRR